jgi:hypothetical protein
VSACSGESNPVPVYGDAFPQDAPQNAPDAAYGAAFPQDAPQNLPEARPVYGVDVPRAPLDQAVATDSEEPMDSTPSIDSSDSRPSLDETESQ